MLLLVVGSALREVCGDQRALGLDFIREARTAPCYRLYEIEKRFAALVEVTEGGISVPGEICSITDSDVEVLLKGEPAGIEARPVRLDDGTTAIGPVSTFVVLPEDSTDISRYGGFAAFLRESKRAGPDGKQLAMK